MEMLARSVRVVDIVAQKSLVRQDWRPMKVRNLGSSNRSRRGPGLGASGCRMLVKTLRATFQLSMVLRVIGPPGLSAVVQRPSWKAVTPGRRESP
jgi:hypothetical protein